jgi:DNA-binding response OmpR family regulator
LTAPYDKEELRLRVSWLLLSRDGKSVGGRVYEVGALRLDVDRHVVTFDSRAARLTPAEFRILATLLEASGGVVAKEELNRSIHRDGEGAAVSTIDGHVSRLRRKLAVLGMDARGISSVHGVGYRLEAEHLDPLSRI